MGGGFAEPCLVQCHLTFLRGDTHQVTGGEGANWGSGGRERKHPGQSHGQNRSLARIQHGSDRLCVDCSLLVAHQEAVVRINLADR